MSSGLSKNCYKRLAYKLYIYIYITNMYKEDLALNNLQGLICRKTHPTTQPTNQQLRSPLSGLVIHKCIYIYIYNVTGKKT